MRSWRQMEPVPETLRHVEEKPHLGNLGMVPHNSVAKAHLWMKALSGWNEVRRRNAFPVLSTCKAWQRRRHCP